MERVAIIVVTYNRLALLKECIESLRGQTYLLRDIIVVNNGSTDETQNWLSEQDDLIVINQENIGGAGGFFTGIKYACEHGYMYSWVMDDDVIAYPDALKNLANKVSFSSGFICSKVLDIEGDMCNVPKIALEKSKKTGEHIWGNKLNQNLLQVEVTSFVSMFFSNSLVYEKGLPYKEYFIWGDDTEFSSRISASNASYMALDSVVVHKRAIQSVLSIFTETDKKRINNYFYAYRNRIHNQRTFGKKVMMYGFSLCELMKLLFLGHFYSAKIVFKGLLAALSFRPSIMYPDNA